jgi:hypothetical protein
MQIRHFQGVLPLCAAIFKAECLRRAEYIQKMHWFARLGRAPFNGSVLIPKLTMPCTLYQPQATCKKKNHSCASEGDGSSERCILACTDAAGSLALVQSSPEGSDAILDDSEAIKWSPIGKEWCAFQS